MKKLKIILAATLLSSILFITGCSESTVNVNVENSESLNGQTFGKSALIEIGNGLYYDSTTRIVYWWNGFYSIANSATTPSPYYAPNGLPYKYNSKTNTFEEIEVNIND